eukprot:Tbor_TRINITY_DN5354_c0_g2::TRINITY_DN5354_c0_g2_i1::g.4606::m.4606
MEYQCTYHSSLSSPGCDSTNTISGYTSVTQIPKTKKKGRTKTKIMGPIQPECCWKSCGMNPGIPDIIAPPIRETMADGRSWSINTIPEALKVKCPCKQCAKKAEMN